MERHYSSLLQKNVRRIRRLIAEIPLKYSFRKSPGKNIAFHRPGRLLCSVQAPRPPHASLRQWRWPGMAKRAATALRIWSKCSSIIKNNKWCTEKERENVYKVSHKSWTVNSIASFFVATIASPTHHSLWAEKTTTKSRRRWNVLLAGEIQWTNSFTYPRNVL